MMFSRIELKRVYALTACLLLIALVSYAAFAVTPLKPPGRIVFQTVAGKALFDHARHAADTGYSLACGECHHTLSKDEYDQAASCTECHDAEQGDASVPKRSDALHQQCIGCHTEYAAGPVECAQCHVMF
jgi:hypothetical protein